MSLANYGNFEKLLMIVQNKKTKEIVECVFCDNFDQYTLVYHMLGRLIETHDIFKLPVKVDHKFDFTLLQQEKK